MNAHLMSRARPAMSLSFALAALVVSFSLAFSACGGDKEEDFKLPSDAVSDGGDTGEGISPQWEDVGGGGADVTLEEDTSGGEADALADSGLADGAGLADAADDAGTGLGCPGGPGCVCQSAGDCDNNKCIETPSGMRCASTCVETCQPGYECKVWPDSGGDAMSYCLPRFLRLCDPCKQSADCKPLGYESVSWCINHGPAAGAYCAVECDNKHPCPDGFVCAKANTHAAPGQISETKQVCVPKPADGADIGACTCSAYAASKQLQTECTAEVLLNGKKLGCPGLRTCSDKGLSPCTAPDPSGEQCDGVDNDCDGDVDEAACDDTNPCTLDLCDPNKSEPANPKAGCSHSNQKGPCNADDDLCTEDDQCAQGVCKPGASKDCDDKNLCTIDSCQPDKGCVNAPDDGKPCDDGNACTLGDKCAAGVCAVGLSKTCTVTQPCVVASCDPKNGECSFAKKPDKTACDDDDPCTIDDVCGAGLCLGAANTCDDGNVCTADSCTKDGGKDGKGGCVHAFKTGTCDDDNKCTVTDVCNPQTGVCAGKPIDALVKCDDDLVCTADSCHPKKGCQHTAQAGSCDDGDACTKDDVCNKVTGKCEGGTLICPPCKSNADCPKPANLCNGMLFCDLKAAQPTCKVNTFSVVKCSAVGTGPCKTNTCIPKTGKCTGLLSAPEGKGCDDGDPCSLDDACVGGSCTGFGQKICDDKNACTGDSCSKKSGGCVHTPLTTSCDDGDPCTFGDSCKGGQCVSGPVVSCDDKNPCTKDFCLKGVGCKSQATTDKCDDGDKCTKGDTCASGTCLGTAVSCDDGNLCTNDSCDKSAGCVFSAVAAFCEDGDKCTFGDQCKDKVCVSGAKVDCDDSNACTLDTCDPKQGCKHTPQAAVCDDGDVCTLKDSCVAGKCVGAGQKKCDDGNLCTENTCNPQKGCVVSFNVKPCDDGDLCTSGDQCSGGKCMAGKVKDCTKFDGSCSEGICKKGACEKVLKTGSCSDGDGCTEGDVCDQGSCKPGKKKNCDDKNVCTVDFCSAGACKHTSNEGGGCDDGDLCTSGDFCKEGKCGGKLLDCSAMDGACTTGKCLAGKCTKINNDGDTCTDNNPCTLSDKCGAGVCKPGTLKSCLGSGECVKVACDVKSGDCKSTYMPETTSCSKGKCDGKGVCKIVCGPQSKHSLDGCTASHFVSSCKSSCLACTLEGGFTAKNLSGCGGESCFAHFDKQANNGFVVMKTQPAETAWVEWTFDKTLCGKFRIWADLPNPAQLGLTSAPCDAWSYPFAAKYLLREGSTTLESKVVNQAVMAGKSVLLFERDMTGVTAVRLGNQSAPQGCQVMLVDRIRAEPF